MKQATYILVYQLTILDEVYDDKWDFISFGDVKYEISTDEGQFNKRKKELLKTLEWDKKYKVWYYIGDIDYKRWGGIDSEEIYSK